MVKVALVVRLVAKPGKEETVASFLAGAQPLAQGEAFTPAWFALRTEPSVFYIVDAFANDADRGKHLSGEIAKALMAKAGELLAEPPKIEKADVLGVKLPG
ncbi:MAG TPA: antibiotic biosynthesis monooxygenase [Polyangiaceae bacterium]|jgi:quinol monooxygenase YgiN|nr:antibiotic biosynthesis monooxygenase [Polyangiaceae bacterium]